MSVHCEKCGQANWLPRVFKDMAERESKLAVALKLALSFAPKGPVPEGLDPTFYHTLNYKDEVELQKRIDEARALVADSEEKSQE